jgi:hypothetical protein
MYSQRDGTEGGGPVTRKKCTVPIILNLAESISHRKEKTTTSSNRSRQRCTVVSQCHRLPYSSIDVRLFL